MSRLPFSDAPTVCTPAGRKPHSSGVSLVVSGSACSSSAKASGSTLTEYSGVRSPYTMFSAPFTVTLTAAGVTWKLHGVTVPTAMSALEGFAFTPTLYSTPPSTGTFPYAFFVRPLRSGSRFSSPSFPSGFSTVTVNASAVISVP